MSLDEISARNQRYSGVENFSEQAGDAQTQQALPESPETLETYTSDEIENIVETRFYKVARFYAEVRNFIVNAPQAEEEQRLFLGKINSETAAKIKEATGINADGKSIVWSCGNIGIFSTDMETPLREALLDRLPLRRRISRTSSRQLFLLIQLPAATRPVKSESCSQRRLTGELLQLPLFRERKSTHVKECSDNKKKQSTSPTPDVQAPSLTSETGRRIKTTSADRVSQNRENVNFRLHKVKKR